MKKHNKLSLAVLLLAAVSLFAGCAAESGTAYSDVPAKITLNPEVTVDTSNLGANPWAFWSTRLNEKLAGQTVKITFSCDMEVKHPENSGTLMWQINNGNSYPEVAHFPFVKDQTPKTHIEETVSVKIENNAMLYLSTYDNDKNGNFPNLKDFRITVENVKIVIDYVDRVPVGLNENDYWLNVPSLKETFKDKFDYFGLAVEEPELLRDSEKQQGLKYHASSITMGNEFKPDFIFNWGLNAATPKEKFTASNGLEIDVPKNLAGFERADSLLAKTKELGLKMRGHVLVWYSQTPKAFFCEGYNQSGSFVNKDVMTARQEWYIKTVLEHVAAWEKANMPEGEHIIYAWDVVNEAVADGASTLRTGSNWYQIYKDDTFIVNAFRFANKYAPKDVKLAYNDYNEASAPKYDGYVKVLESVISHQKDAVLPTRIDIAGMQSHNQPNFPSSSDYERAIKKFISMGLDVHITELDITGPATDNTYTTFKPASDSSLKSTYAGYFDLYLKYAKKGENGHGITSVTLWGINDENSWRASGKPLLFYKAGSKYYAKPAYYGVISAAGK